MAESGGIRRHSMGDDAFVRQMAQFPNLNPGPVLRLDRAALVLLANQAARALFGGESLIGRSWRELCPGMTSELWERILTGEDRVQYEAEIGDHCIDFTLRRPEGGDEVFVYGTDVTARRRAERELSRMAQFPEMNPGPVCRLETDGTVVLANGAARALFGGDVRGQCWLDLCPGMTSERWAEVRASVTPVTLEAPLAGRTLVFTHTHTHDGATVFVYGLDITNQKSAERALQQAERMATLGTLAAGVAHELNNPAAAAARGADQLIGAFAAFQRAQLTLAAVTDPGDVEWLAGLDAAARERALHPVQLDPLDRGDRESDIESWLEDLGIADPWDLAPPLVDLGHDPASLATLAERCGPDRAATVVDWLARAYPVYALLGEIGHGAGRVSEIVRALRSYSYLGQSTVQAVDLNEGIRNTLIILRSKLKAGIPVNQELAEDLPKLEAHGSELNQVWTNLLDNAADAMGGRGRITIRSRRDGDVLEVEMEDNGPGIPADIVGRIFDPFFTTKGPGKGTGLGLHTSHRIIAERHSGTMTVRSAPGRTVFTVRLPITHPRVHAVSEALHGHAERDDDADEGASG